MQSFEISSSLDVKLSDHKKATDSDLIELLSDNLTPQEALKYKEIYNLSRSKDQDIEEKLSIHEIAGIYNIPVIEVSRIIAYVKDKIKPKKVIEPSLKNEEVRFKGNKTNLSRKKDDKNTEIETKDGTEKFAGLSALQILNNPELVITNKDLYLAIKAIINDLVVLGYFMKGVDGSYGNYDKPLFPGLLEKIIFNFKIHYNKDGEGKSIFLNKYTINTQRPIELTGQKSAEENMYNSHRNDNKKYPKELIIMYEGEANAQQNPQEMFRLFAGNFIDAVTPSNYSSYFETINYDKSSLRQLLILKDIGQDKEKLFKVLEAIVKKLIDKGIISESKIFKECYGNSLGIASPNQGEYCYISFGTLNLGVADDKPKILSLSSFYNSQRQRNDTYVDSVRNKDTKYIRIHDLINESSQSAQQIYEKVVETITPLVKPELVKNELIV